jgi:ABC-2 type transport system ATP-binding protein
MNAIELTDVTFRIGNKEIIRAMDLCVPQGDSIGLIGPNGAGKTTLYRLLLGLGKASSGSIRVLGHAMPDRRVLNNIGYMAQTESLYQDLSIEENLLFFGKLYGLKGQAARRRVDEALKLVDLGPQRTVRVEKLSGGMKRRISLAVSIFHSPSLLLLDEPTVGVDPELRISLWKEFMRLNDTGVTILISTHHLDEANHCKKLVLLKEGRVLACQPPDELRKSTGSETTEEAFLTLARRQG